MVSASPSPWKATSGRCSATRSSSERRPSSIRAIAQSPIIVLVMEPMRWRCSGVIGVPVSISARTKPSE
jgi:hypothetical protein